MSYDGKPNPKSTFVKKVGEESHETMDDVLALANPFQAIEDRGITKQVATYLGIRTRRDASGAHVAHYFPYYKLIGGSPTLVGFKKRDLTRPKKVQFSVIGEQDVNCILFGGVVMNNEGVPALVTERTQFNTISIVEGEYDCAALISAIKDAKAVAPTAMPVITSITNGTASAVESISSPVNKKLISHFQHISLGFDNDCASPAETKKGIRKGQEATAQVVALLGEDNVRIIQYPEGKDPCDMVRDGSAPQLIAAWQSPKQYKPAGFIEFADFRERAIELPKLGRSYPWPTLTKKTLGRRFGEGVYIGAGVKMGKSELLNKLVQHIIDHEEAPPCVFKLEETPDETCKKIAGKMFKKQFHNPEKVIFEGNVDIWGKPVPSYDKSYFTEKELIDACDFVGDKVIYYDNYGSANWDDLKEKIRYAVISKGSKDIFIDPLTKLVEGLSADAANTELERLSRDIATMSMDLQFMYYFFCHLKSPFKGTPHEFGGKVMSSQFTGSRAMMRNTFYMWGLERNKDPDAPFIVQNMSHLVILDDRKFGRTGRIRLYYEPETGDFREPTEKENQDYEAALAEFNEGN